MPYIDLRITPEEVPMIAAGTVDGVCVECPEPHQCGLVLNLHETLERINRENQEKIGLPVIQKIPKFIWVKEIYNKFGEITKAHYHLNWELVETGIKIKKDTIQKLLNRKYQLKGNKMYCLRVHDALDEDGHERWWRYVTKQIKPLKFHGFTEEQINNFHCLANDEYEQRKKENNLTRDKLLDKNNFRNKLIKHLCIKHNEKPYQEDVKIFCDICQFYKKASMTAPFRKLDDLVIDMKVEMGLITYEEYYYINH